MPALRRLLLLAAVGLFAPASRGAEVVLYPGFYTTLGDYSHGSYSHSYAGYATLGIDSRYFVTGGVDRISIRQADEDYRQYCGVGAVTILQGRIGTRAHFGRVHGSLENTSPENYRHDITLFGGELFYITARTVVGFSVSHMEADLDRRQTANQWTGRLEHVPFSRLRIVLRPSYVELRDDRALTSLAARLNLLAHPRVLLKTGVVTGARAYYFDNDLLTFFNQNETQNGLAFLQAEWTAWKATTLVGSFIRTPFDGYTIHYVVLGVRTRIGLKGAG